MIDFNRDRMLPLNLGQVVATPGAIDAMRLAGVSPMELLVRHASGDWGQVDAEDWHANDMAIANAERILSVYPLHTGETIWIITEGDRSVTTLLLPSEY